jgi:dTDP-glucose 4,6-dehydratase
MNNIKSFKNILVTGGNGFIASNFINYMVNKYENINFYNIDKLDYCSSINNITVNEYKNYRFFKGDIKSKDLISFILNEYNIDAVLHFAAQSHVDHSINDPVLFTIENVVGTHTLIEECYRYNKLKLFLHISTDEVYGSVFNEVDETYMMNPTNPYASTKAAAECIINTYIKAYNMPIIITRCNNVFGINQYPEKIIPKFILQLINNKRCTIHGDGNNFRNYIHTDDANTAFETIIFKGEMGEIYNIASNNEYSNLEIAKILIREIHGETVNCDNYITYIEDRKCNDKNYSISCNKLNNLGWTIEKDFKDCIKKTIEWYKTTDIHKHWLSITLPGLP